MTLNSDLQNAINSSVLCWLATCSTDGQPNVSPKEIFCEFGNNRIIIANIASPQSVKNIKQNPKVCAGFIDILVQKGFQIKGTAELVGENHGAFKEMEAVLLKMTEGKFHFKTIISIKIEQVKPILAPSYLFYPETTEEKQINSAKRTYGFG